MGLADWEHNFVGILLILISISGIIVNLLLASLIYRRNLQAQTKPNSLLINLIISNIGIIVFAFPFPVYASLKHSWVWGDSWCTYYGAVALLFGFSIMMTLIMLCLDTILQNYYLNYEFYKHKIREFMIIWTWMNSIFWSVAPLCGWSRINYEPVETSCSLDVLHPDSGYTSYIVSCFIFCFLLPIILIIVCRIITYNSVTYTSKEELALVAHNNKKILILMITYILEWGPYSVLYMWPLFADPSTIPIRLSAAAPIFAKFSVITTPLVYLNEKYNKCNSKKN